MRSKASDYGFSKICIAGNSAGGHLAACAAAMHIYPFGAHGFGWDDTMRFKANWVYEFETWLDTIVYPTLR